MRLFRSLVGLSLLIGLAGSLDAQVSVKKGAVVYVGSASNTSAPATINETKVKEATKEWQKIQSEGIDPDSAHGKQLITQMNNSIRDAVKAVASSEGRDLVTRSGDITDRQGRDVVDLTSKVIEKL